MSKCIFRLPCVDGGTAETTTDAKKCMRAWRKLFRPIEKATGYKCMAFDPGLTFNEIKPAYDYTLVKGRNGKYKEKKVRCKDSKGRPVSTFSRSEQISTYFAAKLVKALQHEKATH